MTMAHTVYVVSLFVALGVICPPLTEATGPWNPVPLPVRLGEPVYLLCYPLHSELPLVREAGWSVYNPEDDNWTLILGMDRSNSSWEIKSFVNNSKFTLYGPSHIFLKIDKLTKEDIGTEWRCIVSTWEWVHHKPEAIHYILTLLDDSKEGIPSKITKLAHPTTEPVTAGNETAGGQPINDSGKANCLPWIASFGIASAIALIAICWHNWCHRCCEHHSCSSRQHEVNLCSSVIDKNGPPGGDAYKDLIHQNKCIGQLP